MPKKVKKCPKCKRKVYVVEYPDVWRWEWHPQKSGFICENSLKVYEIIN